MTELTILTVAGLAAANSLNPCALAVLIMALVTVLTNDPRNRKKVLLVGLSFAAAIFFVYLIYGILLVNLFQSINAMPELKIWAYRIDAILGIILGLMNIKDYFSYGSFGFRTEVPTKWRPTMKNIITKITSPAGAFIAGLLVGLILTPCSMGPYLICCSLLGPLGTWASIPWLLFYNLIFISPMIAITLVVYFGFTTVDSVYGWREKNLRLLHLIAGIILLLMGILILFGVI
jgi:cytochrome c biogenesis protein CcdA